MNALTLTGVALFLLYLAFKWAKDDVIRLYMVSLLLMGLGIGVLIGVAIAPFWGPQ